MFMSMVAVLLGCVHLHGNSTDMFISMVAVLLGCVHLHGNSADMFGFTISYTIYTYQSPQLTFSPIVAI